MTRTQKTVFILVAIVALIMGLTVNKVLSGKGQGDPTALIDAGIILLPQSRQLPPVTMTNQDGQPVAFNELKEPVVLRLHVLPGYLPDHPRPIAPDQKRTAERGCG
jgi:cytochrome oxidase Cu insertion factor (SCO1/SenC/PrrC family)